MRPLQHRSSSLSSSSAAAALAVLVVVLSAGVGWCQDVGGGATPAALNSVLASTANELMVNFTRAMEPRIEEHFGFCIRDPNQDLNRAFNFSTDMTFLTNCLMTTPGLYNAPSRTTN